MRNDARANLGARPEWVSISAYARTYGLSRTTVYKLIGLHRLETFSERSALTAIVRVLNKPPGQHRHLSGHALEITPVLDPALGPDGDGQPS